MCSSNPMVDTKYPLAHNDSLSYSPFTRLIFFFIHADDLPFMVCIAYETESLGVSRMQSKGGYNFLLKPSCRTALVYGLAFKRTLRLKPEVFRDKKIAVLLRRFEFLFCYVIFSCYFSRTINSLIYEKKINFQKRRSITIHLFKKFF